MASEVEIKGLYNDIELIKNDLALIKHILIEEGELTDETKKRLAKARSTPKSEYIEL